MPVTERIAFEGVAIVDWSQAMNGLKSLQSQLKNIKLNDTLGRQLKSQIDAAVTSAKQLQGNLDLGMKNPQQTQQMQAAVKTLTKDFLTLQNTMQQLGMSGTIFKPQVASEVQRVEQGLNAVTESLKNVYAQQSREVNFSQMQSGVTEYNRLLREQEAVNARIAAQQALMQRTQRELSREENRGSRGDPKRVAQLQDAVARYQLSILRLEGTSDQLTQNMANIEDAAQGVGNAAPQVDNMAQATNRLGNSGAGLDTLTRRYLSFAAVARIVSRAWRNTFQSIQDIDKAITAISVVTTDTVGELWQDVGRYQKLAQDYGSTTKGVLEATQLYRQQGGFLYVSSILCA